MVAERSLFGLVCDHLLKSKVNDEKQTEAERHWETEYIFQNLQEIDVSDMPTKTWAVRRVRSEEHKRKQSQS